MLTSLYLLSSAFKLSKRVAKQNLYKCTSSTSSSPVSHRQVGNMVIGVKYAVIVLCADDTPTKKSLLYAFLTHLDT